MSIDVRPIAIKIISYKKAFCKYRIFWDSFNLQNPWKVFAEMLFWSLQFCGDTGGMCVCTYDLHSVLRA